MKELSKALKLAAGLVLGATLYASMSPARAAEPVATAKPRVVELSVTQKGFEPDRVKVKKGEPLELRVTRKTDETCATELVMPDQKIKLALPLDKAVSVKLTPQKTGELKY